LTVVIELVINEGPELEVLTYKVLKSSREEYAKGNPVGCKANLVGYANILYIHLLDQHQDSEEEEGLGRHIHHKKDTTDIRQYRNLLFIDLSSAFDHVI